MLKFFFNRFSNAVIAMELAGILLLAADVALLFFRRTEATHAALLLLIIALYAFIRLCAARRWYRDAPRWSGIELHFKKAMVPTSYVIAIVGLMDLVIPHPTWALATAAILLIAVAHVNAILLYLHRRDRDEAPPNYYSSRRFADRPRLD